MDHAMSVAALLGRATGAAEAINDCGLGCDDAELVASFIEGMEQVHQAFVSTITQAQAEALKAGHKPEELNSMFDAVQASMQCSPSWTNVWFLWRLSCILKSMASQDVVEAAREVTAAHGAWLKAPAGKAMNQELAVNRAMAKLAAVLPKEG